MDNNLKIFKKYMHFKDHLHLHFIERIGLIFKFMISKDKFLKK